MYFVQARAVTHMRYHQNLKTTKQVMMKAKLLSKLPFHGHHLPHQMHATLLLVTSTLLQVLCLHLARNTSTLLCQQLKPWPLHHRILHLPPALGINEHARRSLGQQHCKALEQSFQHLARHLSKYPHPHLPHMHYHLLERPKQFNMPKN